MRQEGIKVVFFDAGGTLIAPRSSFGEIYSRVLEPLGIQVDPMEFRQAAREAWSEFDGVIGRGRDRYSHYPGGELEYWLRYVTRVLERVSNAGRAEEAAAALHAAFSDPQAWIVFPEVRPTLKTLRERGKRLGVISNWDSRLRALLESLDLAREFETIVVSCEVGVEKPHEAIFERALESLGVEAREAFHVGDDPISDYEGPRSAGLGAALLVRAGSSPPGVTSVSALDGLLPLIF